MPAVSRSQITDALSEAFAEGGAFALLESESREQPGKYLVRFRDEVFSMWIYIWTLTFGGRPNLPDEFRIQLTGVTSPLALNPTGGTLLLGYHDDTGSFAGFDLNLHRRFTTGSPSVQIGLTCLFQALQNGIAFPRKNNNEIVMGIRPDQLLQYSLNSLDLHRLGKQEGMPEILAEAASPTPVPPETMEVLSEPRKRIVSNVQKWIRHASFRKQVQSAYDQRCAVTRMQLKLVDAAHILPVHFGRSTDQVTNGIALSPTIHRAFDSGLIYMDESYVMRLNTRAKERLAPLGLDGGLRTLEGFMGSRTHLPQDSRQRPSLKIIREANEARGIFR